MHPPLEWLELTEHDGDSLALEYAGPLPALLGWLATRPVAELRVEPLGLGPVYRRYHGGEE